MGGIVWLASYPKSGNTWLRAFLHNLLINPPAPVPINDLDKFCVGESAWMFYRKVSEKPVEDLTAQEIAAIRPTVHANLTKIHPDSVFVKTHNFLGEWHDVPLHNMDVTAGAIYVVRNPLDVAVSMPSHFGLTQDQAIARMGNRNATTDNVDGHVPEFHADWSTHVESWTARPAPNLLVLRYEDMLAKPRAAFSRLTGFLGLNPPKERLEKAIRFSSFKVLSGQEKKGDFKERSQYAKAFFRAGERDQWRKVLTPVQVDRIIQRHGEQMARFGYLPREARRRTAAR